MRPIKRNSKEALNAGPFLKRNSSLCWTIPVRALFCASINLDMVLPLLVNQARQTEQNKPVKNISSIKRIDNFQDTKRVTIVSIIKVKIEIKIVFFISHPFNVSPTTFIS